MLNQDKIRALQDILQTTMSADFDLPRIVVLGSQSSGKSSVLEQILKKDFLPRGNNLVTRCPIIISLKRSEKEGCKIDGFDVPFDSIPNALTEKMTRNCGPEKGIVDKPINVLLCMNNTLDMVLVDLPGLTKIPIGDQPADIEHQILKMANKYISGENTLILCVISANADIATSESLKVAKEVDPSYDRTIGVLTKIDLMDEGTDCTEILNNIHPYLRYGYVGVINRSQYDIVRGLSIDGAIDKEEGWFKGHEPYQRYKEKIGSKYLLKKLCDIFQIIFERELPRIKLSLRNTLDELIRERDLLGCDNKTKRMLLDYSNAVGNLIGVNRETSFSLAKSNLITGWCNDILNHPVHVPLEDLDNFISEEQCLFLPERGFEEKVKDVTKKVTAELLMRSTKGFSTLISVIEEIKHSDYQPMAKYLNEWMIGKLKAQYQIFRDELNKQNALQNSYINLIHPNFFKKGIITKKICERIKTLNVFWGKPLEPEAIFDYNFIKEVIGALVYDYANIFIRDMKDVTIKLIQSLIGYHIREKLIPEIMTFENDPHLHAETNEEIKIKEDLSKDIERLGSAIARLGVEVD